MEEQQQQQRKGPIPLDWDTILDETPAAELVVKPSAMASDQDPQSFIPGLEDLKDYELEEQIRRKKNTLNNAGRNLPDKGAKLRSVIRCYEEELHRRKVNPPPQKVDEKQATTSSNSDGDGVSNKSRRENLLCPQSESSFASCFMKKLDEKKQANCTAIDAFSNEKQHFKHCNNQIVRPNRERKRGKRRRSSSRQLPFKCPRKLPVRDTFSDDKRCQANSVLSLQTVTRNLERRFSKDKGASQAMQSDSSRSRKGQPIVVDDDDDDEDDDDSEDAYILERTENKVPEYLKGARVYFPSRDDPESVEICYNDMECLAPDGYLTSTIMNFYMRYLQQRVSLTILDYCQFFNTYFYNKLTAAVSCKENNREAIFAKFRRWWKGVNIFQKAYVLIPIHQDQHWSLIIICIPDKEDESGPIILHLDSLGLHSSKSVFDNIKSYLIEERNYLNREFASSDVPIADRIWKSLSSSIETRVIPIVSVGLGSSAAVSSAAVFAAQMRPIGSNLTVPQQKNEYDCGLFVLFFIERFMEEAPERLKRKDLAMFGRRWFKAEEASNLRAKIHKLLVAELHNSIKPNGITASSPSSAANATECVETTNVTECVETANATECAETANATECAETAKDSSIEDGIIVAILK